jgi:hypothetical protein
MLKSDLLEDLSAFSLKDKERLLLFLDSPYCQNSRTKDDGSRLLRYLIWVLGQADSGKWAQLLERKHAFEAVFGPVPFHAGRLNQAQHEALCRVREFIQVEMSGAAALREKDYDIAQIADFFMSRGALKVARRYLHQLKRYLEKDSSIGQENDRKKWAAERVLSWYSIAVADVSEGANLPNALEALEHWYFSQRADLLLALLSLETQHKLAPNVDTRQYVDAFFAHPEASWFRTEIGRLYVTAIQTTVGHREEQEQAFEALLTLYLECRNRIEPYERERFETIIYNFCARNFQFPRYREYLLRLYQQKADQLANRAEAIHANAFISLVRLGVYVQDLPFVRQLIAQCRYSVYGPEPGEMYCQLAQAHVAFEEGNYRDSLYLLNGLHFEDLSLHYITRVLEIKNFYELKAETSVESRLHALRIALTRDRQLPAAKRQAFQDFYSITTRLWRLYLTPRERRRASSIHKLRQDIQQRPGVIEARWYQSKLNELAPAQPIAEGTAGG